MSRGAVLLKRWRQRSRLSQREVARRIERTDQLVSELERGATPSLATAIALETKAGIPPRAWLEAA